MSEKGFLSSICGMLKGLFSSDTKQNQPQATYVPPASPPEAVAEPEIETAKTEPVAPVEQEVAAEPIVEKDASVLTTVEQYIQNLASKASSMTSVERYILNLASSQQTMTSVERYIQNKASQATTMTSVERYIQNIASTPNTSMTSVERYIQNNANCTQVITSVERYIRNKSKAKQMTSVEKYIQGLS
mgnify:CR=1 FL=1